MEKTQLSSLSPFPCCRSESRTMALAHWKRSSSLTLPKPKTKKKLFDYGSPWKLFLLGVSSSLARNLAPSALRSFSLWSIIHVNLFFFSLLSFACSSKRVSHAVTSQITMAFCFFFVLLHKLSSSLLVCINNSPAVVIIRDWKDIVRYES